MFRLLTWRIWKFRGHWNLRLARRLPSWWPSLNCYHLFTAACFPFHSRTLPSFKLTTFSSVDKAGTFWIRDSEASFFLLQCASHALATWNRTSSGQQGPFKEWRPVRCIYKAGWFIPAVFAEWLVDDSCLGSAAIIATFEKTQDYAHVTS